MPLVHEYYDDDKDWDGQFQGKLNDRYEGYVRCMQGTGEKIKTFEEWLGS